MDQENPVNSPGQVTPPAAPPTNPLSTGPAAPPATPTVGPAPASSPPPVPEAPQTESPKSGVRSFLSSAALGIINWVVIPVAIVLILHNFVFQAFHVVGTSMVPTLHETDYLIVSKVGATDSSLARLVGRNSPYIPKRDEIIVFHYPKDPTLIFIKRVIGLPGERVVVSGGHVTIYNSTHPQGFNPDAGTVRTQYPTLGDIDEVIPQGEIFVLGDNRTPNGSYDSRDWGTLPYHYIIGEATLRLLPVNQAGLI